MRHVTSKLMLCLSLCTLFCCSPKPFTAVMVRPASCSDQVQFAEAASMGHLLSFADKMHKPVFLYFCVPWVEPCKRMEQYVFTQNEMASYYNRNFINYKVNVEGSHAASDLANKFGVTSFPTMVYVDGKGKVMRRHTGPATAAQLLEIGYFLHEAVEKEYLTLGGR